MPTFFNRLARHDTQAASLELDHVSVTYDDFPALEDITFTLSRGEQVAIVGPNGAGKSTLFNVIAGIIRPQQGKVRVYGSGPRGHICVGYVPQRNRIDWRFPVSIMDVVMMKPTNRARTYVGDMRHDWPVAAPMR
jgi:ABC-type Mn2+/Zn2+ transport system ATPase subunit